MFLEPHAIAAVLCRALAAHDRELAREQAVRGIDALKETEIHALIASGLNAEGLGVLREVPYPNDTARTENDRDRCDLVLTPSPGDRLADPVHAARRIRAAESTLFAPLAAGIEARAAQGEIDPADALWLEIKAIAQHAYRRGVPAPNRQYSSELVDGPAGDIAKLDCDGIIRHAASVVVLFTESEQIAVHDIDAMAHRLIDRDLPVGVPAVESHPMTDRAGNAAVTVAVLRVRCGHGDRF
ncbi:MAG TPA: hypothetical protein ENK11_01785 [Phycisphaerales bacterium]|nr:hypothetical protein [Phycisphaerales bacterium]